MLRRIDGKTEQAGAWHVETFSTPEVGFVGSVALEAKPDSISFFAFE
jgi:hypothetical protein